MMLKKGVMKIIPSVLAALLLAAPLSGCAVNTEEKAAAATPVAVNASLPESNSGTLVKEQPTVLIAYFSLADNTILDGNVDAVATPSVTPPGNVGRLATWLQESTGGDLFPIRVTEPYPSDWDGCLERSGYEKDQDAQPQLAASVTDMAKYDVVFLGYPNWSYGVPRPVLSFIEENNLSGKRVYLFCSHGTGGLARSVQEIQQVMPSGAILSDNVYDVFADDTPSAQASLLSWANDVMQ